MKINVFNQIEGSKKAQGLTVIIDVFRAFSVECFLAEAGVSKIIPMSDIQDCLALREKHPEYFLIGERGGIKLESFDSGNSPSYLTTAVNLKGRTVLHNTSAGTQGLINACSVADEVLTGSFLNAGAIAKYIKRQSPSVVTLVCMGLNGIEESAEDSLCAEYIKAKIEGKTLNIHRKIANLKNTSGSKFFDSSRRLSFPEPDFFMCLVPDVFDFVLRANTLKTPIEMERIDVL